MKNQTKQKRKDGDSYFWVENWPKQPVWSSEEGNCSVFHEVTVLEKQDGV